MGSLYVLKRYQIVSLNYYDYFVSFDTNIFGFLMKIVLGISR